MLKQGMNFFEVRIHYNKNDKINKITSLSGNSRINTVFEKNIAKVFKESEFKSPSIDDVSYEGEMMFYIFYMKD